MSLTTNDWHWSESDGSTQSTKTTTYTHDRNGNELTQITRITGGDKDGQTMSQYNRYNPLGQLTLNRTITTIPPTGIGANLSNTNITTTTTYTYRSDGLRHTKTISRPFTVTPHSITHIWNGTHIVAERRNEVSGSTGLTLAGNPTHQTTPQAVFNIFNRDITGRLVHSYHHGFYIHNARGDVVQRVEIVADDLQIHNTDEHNRDAMVLL